ncbi:hypothetical protein CA13_71760 [Planctomycetes bacterium CA13]|uniref:Prepilin-type N-terminal cleavage/methylation domain-containing protein n=1 Tax=Novipirellula herctigrandis TaxID=2527986 RepID=A0A5C5YPC9_9BACT|nr:hypothetical protein CA13_71760 [Planctomycetes bacterium CA13]
MKPRSGVTLTELLVAATVVVTGMAIVAPLAIRSGRMWLETRAQHIAMDELSNQLEQIISLPANELPAELPRLAASDWATERLPGVQLNGERLGHDAVRVSINWTRVGDPKPIELIGWISPQETSE